MAIALRPRCGRGVVDPTPILAVCRYGGAAAHTAGPSRSEASPRRQVHIVTPNMDEGRAAADIMYVHASVARRVVDFRLTLDCEHWHPRTRTATATVLAALASGQRWSCHSRQADTAPRSNCSTVALVRTLSSHDPRFESPQKPAAQVLFKR